MNYIIILIIFAILIISGILYICYTKKNRTHNNNKSKLEYAHINDVFENPFILQHFITPKQCKDIIQYSSDKLIDSEVVGGKYENIRNSKQCWISKNDSLVKSMFDKISNMFNIPLENAEDLQVVRYLPNQYFNEHHDSCCDNNDKCHVFIKNGGQRKLTVLIYLNNEFEGGNTYFKNLNLKFKPPTGYAIIFFPLANGTNKCHPLALHAGMPVTKGVKWIANLWYRESKFS